MILRYSAIFQDSECNHLYDKTKWLLQNHQNRFFHNSHLFLLLCSYCLFCSYCAVRTLLSIFSEKSLRSSEKLGL